MNDQDTGDAIVKSTKDDIALVNSIAAATAELNNLLAVAASAGLEAVITTSDLHTYGSRVTRLILSIDVKRLIRPDYCRT